MLRLYPTLLFAVLALGMGFRRQPVPELPPPPVQAPETLPAKAPNIKVRILVKSLTNFSPAAAARFRKVVANLETVVNSPEFEAGVKGWYHKGKNEFFDTTDTPAQVFNKITSKDWELEYKMMWLAHKSTVGYTKPEVSWIALNTRNYLADEDLAQNICHEYGAHKLGGYVHSYYPTADRPFSGPYGVGYLCGTIYEKMFPTK